MLRNWILPPQRWENFDEVQDSVAESKWAARITNIAPQARTENRLKSEIKWLIGSYAESDNPRDVLIEYLKGPSCKKPFAKSPQEHADRMEVLIRIANRLDGTAPNIDDSNTKKCCDIQIYWACKLRCTTGIYDACSYLYVCSAIV